MGLVCCNRRRRVSQPLTGFLFDRELVERESIILKPRGLEGKNIFFVIEYNIMTEKEHNDKGEPILLDGSPLCPRQNLEGRFKDDPVSKYLNFEEWLEMTDMEDIRPYELPPKNYKFDTPTIRIQRMDRYLELLDKIDLYELNETIDERLRKLRVARASARVVNRYELGAREFTFTYSPKWFNDAEARLQMSSAIQKLVKYYKDEIIQMRAIGEVGSAGLSHIHCFYKLKNGKKITDKNFQRAYKMWDTKKKTGPSGHQGGHHATVKNESDFSGYIDKDIENSWFEVNIDSSLDPQ